VEALLRRLSLPTRLHGAGVPKEAVAAIASAALPEVRSRGWPWAEMTEEGLTALLHEMW
jgi:hypothetical protein